ncbi:carboxymuconolactone decarboxylase family protein [Sinimarinibacterium sp. NLF-5-8]|uniref:carboxymuconolactone decarboxylase family protein n=1 Tax=Sinimarinibacterium sp. NLF-5-8 TaxID=2698684 RepID=UPI00137B96DF|nr:carboxymuconolactone decarboxylase family protein [Sinimarinibacterium sp. NLF-5-8]QHS10790.1 carboxymuconolactone decarboxylase family protein [Sinimarinibacterium sp. NLF-5-8]
MSVALEHLAPPGGWLSTEAPRLPPLRHAELNWPLRTLLGAAGKWGKSRTGTEVVPDVFLLLLRAPTLFKPWLHFASRLMPYGTLDRRDAELMILRVGWNCRCRYEWGQHVQIGLRAGLSEAEIARVAEGATAPGWSPLRAALLRACDELHADRQIAATTWDTLAAHYDAAQLIEVTMLIGHYQMLAGVLNSAALPLEAHTEAALRHP